MPAPKPEQTAERQKSFGLRLRRERELRDVSRATLAATAQVHPEIVAEIEQGHRPMALSRVVDYGAVGIAAARSYLDEAEEERLPRLCITSLTTLRALQAKSADVVRDLLAGMVTGEFTAELLEALDQGITELMSGLQQVRQDVRVRRGMKRDAQLEIAGLAKSKLGPLSTRRTA